VNIKIKKGIFWGVIVSSMVLVINVLHFLLGGSSAFARGPHGQGTSGMGRGGGSGGHQMMHNGGFPWLFLIIGLAVLVLLVRWLRKKSKSSSVQQFINTSVVGSQLPVTNQNASALDQWEKNLVTKKENE
jgi:hypothetical protein